MPYTEDDLLPLSALRHLLFCERQCAAHSCRAVVGRESVHRGGQVLHRQAHDGKPQTRDGVRITRGLPLSSFSLGLTGKADVVEFRPPADQTADDQATSLAGWLRERVALGLAGWTVTPIEYKRGSPKRNDCDRVQLCAQALCLEEMLSVHIEAGQLFYGEKRRRFDVPFDEQLRATTTEAAATLHAMFQSGTTPPAVREKKCDTCSLLPVCLPDAMSRGSASKHFDRQLKQSLAVTDG
ncbi:MAG: CRISPR-associated protein Cas4 [Planctomycetaceae bacterium]